MANMKIQGKIIKFQIGSGSTVNVIPRSIAGDDKLLPCDTDLQSWSGQSVIPVSRKQLVVEKCKTKKKYSLEFIVVDFEYTPVIRKVDCEKMKLITVNYENINSMDTVNKYNTVLMMV